MRFGGTWLVAVLCVMRAALAMAEESAARPDFSVLTPAIQGRYFLSSDADLTAFVPPYVAFGKLGSGGRATKLRALVAREGYEPIPRKPAGSLQSLSWDDLPEKPQGELMLDLTVHWICLCADIAFSKHYPAMSVSWRLLDPAQEVVEPSRTLTYHHFPAWYSEDKAKAAKARGATIATPYPVETVSESCGFTSVKVAEENPAVLWSCFREAFDVVARRLVIDLTRIRPPREAATVSSGTPSGTSTR